MNIQALEGYRLSPQQRRLWILREARKESPDFVAAVLVCEAGLDVLRMQQAFAEVMARHEIMRTVFHPLGALQFPVQVIRQNMDAWLPGEDLSDKGEADGWQTELAKVYGDFCKPAWDVQNGPLIQARMVKLPASRNALLIRVAKLCSDKAGLRNVIIQMLQRYAGCAFQGQQQPPQYADISEYLNEGLESENTTAARQYWNKRKDEPLPLLRLSADSANGSADSEEILRWRLHPGTVVRIEELALCTGISAADILLAGWQIVLSRFFYQDEFAMGMVCSGRRLEGLNGIPGVFERTLPLECHIARDWSFIELLQRVAAETRELVQWQDYFGYGATDEKDLEPTVVVEYYSPQPLPVDDLAARVFTADESLYPAQLKLLCIWDAESPTLQISYLQVALSKSDVAALKDQLDTLLLNAAIAPSTPVSGLSTLSPETRKCLLHEFNKTELLYPNTLLAHQRFELQARLNPFRPAVTAGKATLSYGELDCKSTSMANLLRLRGIGPESAIGVCMERSPELLISLLGILKTGAFYVPLDPEYPDERLAYVLSDSKAELILSKTKWNSRFAASQVPVLNLDVGNVSEYPGDVKAEIHPDNLAYSIYTSGSTGKPKGVAISHKALANYLSWCEDKYDLSKGRGVIVHSSIGFDLTVTTLLAPLAAGQLIILIDEENATEGLARLLHKDAGFTLIKVTPAHLQALSQMVDPRDLAGASHTVVIGGEALLGAHVEDWRLESPQTRLINEYGPTETTVGCSVYEIPGSGLSSGPVPIGKPVANAELYVLDEEMQPLPIRTAGELYVGGAGLARGYFEQPALTAENFVPHPFSTSPGQRLYKTGDRAQMGADGILHFLGRTDEQIKLRGYRIEPGEIEHTLRQNSSVRNSAVILIEGEKQKQLVAYVVTKPDHASPDDLRAFLFNKLPEYMVPAQVIFIDRLPLTFNGKVDKRSLHDLYLQSCSAEREYVAPANAKQQILADLWAQALGLERVGIHDNFFELGGDSIISIQIVNRAKQMGVIVTPRQLFHHRTVAELAKIAKSDLNAISSSIKPLHDSIMLTPIQKWFFEQNFSRPHHWNQAMLLEAHEKIDSDLLKKALSLVVERHDALRLRFGSPENIKPSLTADAGASSIATLELTQATGHDEQLLEKFASELQSGLDIFHGPLMRVGLIRKPGSHDRILWVVHHLAVDVVSWGILFADLTEAYRQLNRRVAIHLDAGTSTFQEWSLRLHEYGESDELKKEEHYWLAQASRNRTKVPIDHQNGENTESSAQILWCSLNGEETSRLMQQVPRAHHTMINDVLLSALLQSFCNWSGEKSITLDLENHGREELFEGMDLSRTVGWFTCIFPVTLTLVSIYDCVHNLRAVKEQVRSIPTGGIGYGVLRYIAQNTPAHTLRQWPQSEIIFNYLGRSARKMDDEPSLFTVCDGAVGLARDPSAHRAYLLEVTGGVNHKGELRMAFIYSQNLHREASIQKLSNGFIAALHEIISSCSISPVLPSMVDLSMPQLSSSDLNRLVEELSRSEESNE